MKLLRIVCALVLVLMTRLSVAEEMASAAGAEQGPAKDGKEPKGTDARALLEKGRAAGELPEGMVIRLAVCLGEPDAKLPDDAAPDELIEVWEFTTGQVHRVKCDYSTGNCVHQRVEARDYDSKDLCKVLLEGQAMEIHASKGEGPEVGFVGTHYRRGSRSIEVEWEGKTVLGLMETNGPFLMLYRETDARAFGALYERLSSRAHAVFQPKSAQAK
jgi:hypothetical protein